MKYDIHDPLMQKIIANFQKKNDEELLEIYKSQIGPTQWSYEAFDAAEYVLTGRGIELPKIEKKSEEEIDQEVEEEWKKEKIEIKSAISFFIPRYNELSIFIISFSLMYLLAVSKPFKKVAGSYVASGDPRGIIVLLMMIGGMSFSIFHVFSQKEKGVLDKALMLYFTVIVSGLIGLTASVHILEEAKGIFILFPIWNIINCALLLLLYRFSIIDISAISDIDITPTQLLIGTSTALAVLVVCHFFLEYHWSITFSIAVAYATSINHAVEKIFFRDSKTQGD